MANEAVLKTETELPVNNVLDGDGNAIEKGTLLTFSGGASANIASTGRADKFAGIAAGEKIASDGIMSIAAYKAGKFDILASSGATITTGAIVTSSGANQVDTATEAEIAAGGAVGRALEDSAKGTEEVIEVMVGY